MIKIGIVIPYYKITYFNDTLQSLAIQTDQRFKVYIGDDNSLEDVSGLLENYVGKFDFVYHRFETNLGSISLTQQWQRCIDLTNEEQWLMILGDDDVLDKNAIKSFYDTIDQIEQEKIYVIRFATQKIDENGKTISKIYEHPEIEKATNFLFNKTRSSLSEYVFRRVEILKFGFKNFPLAWYSDVLAVFEFSSYGKLFSINKSISYIRVSKLSISGNSLNEKLKLQAKFEFYYYLINYRFNYFSNAELDELYFSINKCYINNKKQYVFFLKITKMYFQKKLFKKYFLFINQLIFFTNNKIKS